MILPTTLLKSMVDEIVAIDRDNTIKLTLNLRNHQDPSFKIDDALVDMFSFEQNFMTNTMDKIQMSINIKPKQMQQLVTRQSDLYADLTIEYIDSTTMDISLDDDPLVFRYKVLVHDLTGISKRYGINAFETTDGSDNVSNSEGSVRIPLDLQLIGETEHKVNRASFNGIIQSINPEEAIRYVASVMGISKIKMVPPDNTTKFQHISIPPEYSNFKSVFEYLHSKSGIYANGFRNYMTNGMMYVYPPFNMDSKETPRLNILRVSTNTYMGAKNFFKVENNKDLSIISNTDLSAKNLSNVGSENDGNTKVFVRSDGMLDGQVKKGKTMSLTNVTASMSSRADNSISKGAAVSKYVKPTLNMYNQASTFSETNTEVMGMGWQNARMGMITPGMPVTFIFDEKDTVMSKKGIIEMIKYDFTKATTNVFTCGATMMIRVDPKQVPYDV